MKVKTLNIMFLISILLFECGVILAVSNYNSLPEYQYISTEPNRRAGTTIYTMIYLYNGEVKYLYFDFQETAEEFKRITGMAKE